jgi:hypothetical protein
MLAQPNLSLTIPTTLLSQFGSGCAAVPRLLHGSVSPLRRIEGTLHGVRTSDSVRGGPLVCLLLPGGDSALWLAPGPALRAAVQRMASERGVAASELALVARGGRVVASGLVRRRCMQPEAAVVMRLAWRARGGGCGASRVAIAASTGRTARASWLVGTALRVTARRSRWGMRVKGGRWKARGQSRRWSWCRRRRKRVGWGAEAGRVGWGTRRLRGKEVGHR